MNRLNATPSGESSLLSDVDELEPHLQADLGGRVDVSKFKEQGEAYRVAKKSAHEHLLTGAGAGLAQAMSEMGLSQQSPAVTQDWEAMKRYREEHGIHIH